MEILLRPAIGLMNRLKYWAKFLLIFVVFMVAVGVAMFELYAQIETGVKLAKQERIGVEYIKPLRVLMKDVMDHGEVTSLLLSGEVDMKPERDAINVRLGKDVQALDALAAKYGDKLKSATEWGLLRKAVIKMRDESLSLTVDQGEELTQDTLDDLTTLMTNVADSSNLTLDPDIDSFYIQDTLIRKIPAAIAELTRVQRTSFEVLLRQARTEEERTHLVVQSGLINDGADSTLTNMKSAFDYNSALSALAGPDVKAYTAATKAYLDLLDNKIADAEKIELTPDELVDASDKFESATFKMFDTLLPQLDNLLVVRIKGLKKVELKAELSIVAVLAVVVYLFLGFYRSVTQATAALAATAQKVAAGDLKARAEIHTRDEMAPVATAFNNMVGEVDKMLSASQEQNRRNQEAIIRLLDEIGGLADGDLTQRATVTEDFTGAIADAMNYTIDALRELVGTINSTALQVTEATGHTHSTALRLSDASDMQAQQINVAGTAITEITNSARRVADNAQASTEVARRSVEIAKRGAVTVHGTIQGMESIREQIQETSKRIKRLGESSQEIGEIVGLINDIADQTNILALNASIEAAMAGEAGRGFVVVADEVQQLAERVSNSTRQIENLVKAIQSDTAEAATSMEKSTAGVVSGSQLAEEAGKALTEIEAVSVDLASLIGNISEAAQQQSVAANDISETMRQIQSVTVQTSQGTTETAESVTKLADMAQLLKHSVSGFKLPAA